MLLLLPFLTVLEESFYAKVNFQFIAMLDSPLASCKSQLNIDNSAGLQTLLLSLISLKVRCTITLNAFLLVDLQLIDSRSAAVSFLRGTLFGIQTNEDLERMTNEAISSLLSNGLIVECNVPPYCNIG